MWYLRNYITALDEGAESEERVVLLFYFSFPAVVPRWNLPSGWQYGMCRGAVSIGINFEASHSPVIPELSRLASNRSITVLTRLARISYADEWDFFWLMGAGTPTPPNF